MVTRRMEADPEKRILNASECLTVDQAFRAVTCDAAWQCHADKWTGDLSVGKHADLIVLAKDPFTIKPEAYEYADTSTSTTPLRDVPVLMTICGGIVTFRSEMKNE
mmetsp:Transcript_17711/g.21825  ORF Transcript_17711/g.21825 Transcript_17711/m.21825 type:complete len:106 (-) Transcript_17711:728-1045(-)